MDIFTQLKWLRIKGLTLNQAIAEIESKLHGRLSPQIIDLAKREWDFYEGDYQLDKGGNYAREKSKVQG